jgi:HEAT repeat protein
LFAVVVSLAHSQGPDRLVAQKWQISGIAAALDDPLPLVRSRAIEQLARFSKFEGIPPSRIAEFLLDSDDNIRAKAAAALGASGAKDQAPELVKLLEPFNHFVVPAAVTALGDMRANDYAGELVELLKYGRDYAVNRAAAEALGTMEAHEQVPAVVKLLESRELYIRLAAAEALGALHAKEQAAKLIKLLTDDNPNVRVASANALGTMQASEQANDLVRLLQDSDRRVCIAAVAALGAMEAKEQAPAIIKLIEASAHLVRSPPRTPRGIALTTPDSDIRVSGANALADMHATEYAAELVLLLKDNDPSVRYAAAAALGKMQVKEQIPAVVHLLQDADPPVRDAAATALGKMRANEQIPAVVRLLQDPDQYVRIAAATALGTMQAKEQATEVVKLIQSPNSVEVMSAAIAALGAMQAKGQIPALVKLLRDSHRDVRVAAGEALAMMQAKEFAEEIVKALQDYSEDFYVLTAMGPLPPNIVVSLSAPYYFSRPLQAEIRFLSYYLTGGDTRARLVLRRIMFEPGQQLPKLTSTAEARATLHAFDDMMPTKRVDSRFAVEADNQILQITGDFRGSWSSSDAVIFASLYRKMDKNTRAALEVLVEAPWWQKPLDKLWKVAAAQLVFWILLLYLYPASPHVQAFFFWNRWARRFFGLGYVDFLLTWIPFLRNRLLAPFHEELVADARIGDDSLKEYYADVEVQEIGGTHPMCLGDAIPEVRGHILLEGESGLGKSMFLRRLVKDAKFPIAYLPADSCDHGVFEGIQLRLKGKARDDSFLKTILWSGGLRVVIDGLNEVTVETREKIRRFLDDFPKAHVLLATQPLQWKRPPNARALRLLKLSDSLILNFLETRYSSFHDSAPMTQAAYKFKCAVYLEEVLDDARSQEDRDAARLVLSNPMDLTTVARILVRGGRPTLTNLQEQQFRRAKADFEDARPGWEFPVQRFSESVYQRRLSDEMTLDSSQFFEAIQTMVAHKMVLEQNGVDAAGNPTRKWVFRHDKIRDYFLMQAVLSQQDDRIPKHIDDLRFRGVYLMLASQLPVDQARDLRDALVELASETKDHYLSDAVVQILRTRGPSSRLAEPILRQQRETPTQRAGA